MIAMNNVIRQICTEYTKIENYEEALKSDERYVLHHCAEFRYTSKELKAMNKYYHRPPEELIFIPACLHYECIELHIGRVRSARGKLKSNRKKLDSTHKKTKVVEEIARLKALQSFYKAVSK